MRDPVDLEGAFRSGAVEVEHVASDRMLAPELHPACLAAQLAPQQAFRQARVSALRTGEGVVVVALAQFTPPSALRAATSPSLRDGEGLNTLRFR
jgi:hypothetical protein